MKRDKRQRWLNFLNLRDHDIFNKYTTPILCSYCKYFELHTYTDYWSGESDSEPTCEHPLEIINYQVFDNALAGGDCWAFRPKVKLRDLCKDYCKEEELDWVVEQQNDLPIKYNCSICGIKYSWLNSDLQGICFDCANRWFEFRKKLLNDY